MSVCERNRGTEAEGNVAVRDPGVASIVPERVLRPLLVDVVGSPTMLLCSCRPLNFANQCCWWKGYAALVDSIFG